MRRLIRSFYHAGRGIFFALRYERNLQIHFIAAFLVLFLGFLLRLCLLEFVLIIIVIFLVIVAEIINSTVELIIDYINPSFNQKARLIKDLSAGMVLLTSLGAVIVGILIFYPHLKMLVK